MNPRIAVLGATGAVGSIVRQLLAERQFPFQSIRFFGSPSSPAGRTVIYDGRDVSVEPLLPESLQDVDLAIASTPDEVAARIAPYVTKYGGVLVDESGFHRMRSDVPLVIPEVNPHALDSHKGIVASPNCSTTQMVVCLHPIHQKYRIKRVVVSTYQAASGAGNAARQELIDGTKAYLNGAPAQNVEFESPLPMNLWPKIGSLRDHGATSEETKMVDETRKILEDDTIGVFVTCVRVPVTNCHSESIVVETELPIDPEGAAALLENSPGITVVNDPQSLTLPTPLNSSGKDDVFVGRIRRDPSVPNGIGFWCVSDNLRKGAATNAVQIAELIVERGLWNAR